MLSMFGFKSTETGRVSEEELRLIVTGAKMSGGIESQEGMMIEGVLDLQVWQGFVFGVWCLVYGTSGCEDKSYATPKHDPVTAMLSRSRTSVSQRSAGISSGFRYVVQVAASR